MFVTVASPEDGALREAYRASDIPVVIEPRVLTHWPEARRLLGAFDLVVPNTVLGWNVVLSARSAEVPCVWLVHESRFGEDLAAGSRGCADAFQAAGAVVFPSRSAARLYERFFDGAPGLAVYYGIDDPAAQQVVTPPFFRDPSHLRLVQVGTVEHRKGADVLVAALRLMPAAVVETTDVLFVGRLHELDYVGRVRAAAHGLPNVKFVGEVSRSEVLGYMSCADAVVCSSRDETGPIVVIEAMALGKAVVSTKVGAAAEVITSGEDGVLVDVGDAGALSLALTIGLDAEDRRRLGRAARATYERELTIGRYGRDLLAVFTRVMDGAR
jgi:glycosyltransferase involved in cell wall biosynthesis